VYSTRLGPSERAAALRTMAAETLDVLVIGGGVTGCGAALDAATRGLSVGVVEQRDWASGTSSRSSKLIHGGLRYLEKLDFGLVREALREQTLMLEVLCPHLVTPVSFLFPLTHRFWERAYIGIGTLLYDMLGGRRALPRHRHFTRKGALARFPGLRQDAFTGAIQYFDAQVDDARHTMTLARTAARHGAAMATSVRVLDLLEQDGRINGARVRCLESGTTIDVHARQVLNATGVWTDSLQSMAGPSDIRVRASKGIHLVVPRDRIEGEGGLILRTPKSVLFVIPWKRHWIIGTTDTDWNLDFSHPAASHLDIDYLLETLNAVLAQPLRREDIEGVYAGLRPLLYGESDATSTLTREHAVSRTIPGLVTVAGGKYTTYRVMAKDAVDAVAQELGRSVPESCTERTPLLGADGFEGAWNRRAVTARENGLAPAQVERLLRRHGSCIDEILALAKQRPELAEPLTGAPDYLAAEALYATSHEGALHLDDVLTRRTRISIETFDRGLAAAPHVAELMREVLNWNDATFKREIDHYAARVAAERDSQEQPDDRTADAARVGAEDVRMGGAGATQLEVVRGDQEPRRAH
jgi:glycerol-3-phosphate dehydrogenase